MPSCIGRIKASTGKKAAPHFGCAGYARQTISKTILVLELTVWHNCIISFSTHNLLLQGSIQPCAAQHEGPGALCASSSTQGGSIPHCNEVSITGSHRDCHAGPHNLPSGRHWCSHYPVACAAENRIWYFDLDGLHSTWSLFHGQCRRLCRKTACTALLKSMAPQFMSRHRYKTGSFAIS